MSEERQPANGESEDTQPKVEFVDPKSLTVDPELHHLIPQHKKSEVALLERSLLDEKECYEPLLVWEHAREVDPA